MTGYYARKLSGRSLQRCYELAPARVKQYLEAEVQHVMDRLRPTDTVIELGCGYGRVTSRLVHPAHRVVGIDNASANLELARQLAGPSPGCEYVQMDALDLRFPDCSFDAVVCVQNGICAFGVDRVSLVREALRVTREGGVALFSTYSDEIWPERLAWFEAQAAEGLIGAVDRIASGDGTIACEDGFRAGRLTRQDFHNLCSQIDVEPTIVRVDESSVFCEIVKPGVAGGKNTTMAGNPVSQFRN